MAAKSRRDGCEVCGQPHPRCRAHNKAGKPCGRYPAEDLEVCDRHGAKSPQAQAGVKVRELERKAEKALRQRWALGEDMAVSDPLRALAEVAGEAVAFKDYLRDEVTKLDGQLTYWTERTYDDGDEIHTAAIENVRATVAAYERALERCAKVLANIVKLDLAGRMLEVNQRKADLIVEAVRVGLAQVDMPAEIRRGAQEAIADAIVSLSSTARPAALEAG